MKKLTITAIIILAIGSIVALICFLPYYTMTYCEVVSQEENVITFVDSSDNEWIFYCEEGDRYEVGEMIKVKMHDGWTKEVQTDDKVVNVERW